MNLRHSTDTIILTDLTDEGLRHRGLIGLFRVTQHDAARSGQGPGPLAPRPGPLPYSMMTAYHSSKIGVNRQKREYTVIAFTYNSKKCKLIHRERKQIRGRLGVGGQGQWEAQMIKELGKLLG